MKHVLVNPSHCLVFLHKHLPTRVIGIFFGYPNEMTRNTAKVSECSDRTDYEWFLIKMELTTSNPLSQPSYQDAVDINNVYISFSSCSEH